MVKGSLRKQWDWRGFANLVRDSTETRRRWPIATMVQPNADDVVLKLAQAEGNLAPVFIFTAATAAVFDGSMVL